MADEDNQGNEQGGTPQEEPDLIKRLDNAREEVSGLAQRFSFNRLESLVDAKRGTGVEDITQLNDEQRGHIVQTVLERDSDFYVGKMLEVDVTKAGFYGRERLKKLYFEDAGLDSPEAMQKAATGLGSLDAAIIGEQTRQIAVKLAGVLSQAVPAKIADNEVPTLAEQLRKRFVPFDIELDTSKIRKPEAFLLYQQLKAAEPNVKALSEAAMPYIVKKGEN